MSRGLECLELQPKQLEILRKEDLSLKKGETTSFSFEINAPSSILIVSFSEFQLASLDEVFRDNERFRGLMVGRREDADEERDKGIEVSLKGPGIEQKTKRFIDSTKDHIAIQFPQLGRYEITIKAFEDVDDQVFINLFPQSIMLDELEDYSVFVVVAPRRSFGALEEKAMLRYLENGGNVLFLVDSRAATNTSSFLSEFGVMCESKEINDGKQSTKLGKYETEKAPIIQLFNRDHPIFSEVRSFCLPENALAKVIAPSNSLAWSGPESYVVAGSVFYSSYVPRTEKKKERFQL